MKKIIYLPIAAFVMILFTMQSCKKDSQIANVIDQKTSGYQVKNGRLVFNNIKSCDSLSLVLSQKSEKDFKSWENSINYKSHNTFEQEAVEENWNNYLQNDTISSGIEYNKNIIGLYSFVYNQNGEVQIGDSISFFDGKNIYFVKYEGETAFSKIKEEIITSKLKSLNNQYRCLELKIDTVKRKTSKLKALEVENSYQHEFQDPNYPAVFKFVEQCVIVSQGSLNKMHFVNYQIQIYLEYWRHRSWPHHNEWDYAGENVYKSLSLSDNHHWASIGFNTPVLNNNPNYGTNWEIDYTSSPIEEYISGWMKEVFPTTSSETLYENDSDLFYYCSNY